MSAMRRVYKYGPLEIGEPSSVEMPRGARPVAFSAQGGRHLYVWADVDLSVGKVPWRYIVVGTGHQVPPHAEHVGSWVSDDYVWHLYALGKPG